MPIITVPIENCPIHFETNSTVHEKKFITSLRKVIKEDIEKGVTWDKFGGIVVTSEMVPLVVESGLITQQQLEESVRNGKSTITFQGKAVWDMFDYETEKLVGDDHSYYQRVLIIMDSAQMKEKYGNFDLVTIDCEEKIL